MSDGKSGMNVFMFVGCITKDPEWRDAGQQGASINFHVSIGMGERLSEVWAQCTLYGRKAIEQADDLYAGQVVTVEGSVTGCAGGPIYVRVRNVVPHYLDEEQEDEAAA